MQPNSHTNAAPLVAEIKILERLYVEAKARSDNAKMVRNEARAAYERIAAVARCIAEIDAEIAVKKEASRYISERIAACDQKNVVLSLDVVTPAELDERKNNIEEELAKRRKRRDLLASRGLAPSHLNYDEVCPPYNSPELAEPSCDTEIIREIENRIKEREDDLNAIEHHRGESENAVQRREALANECERLADERQAVSVAINVLYIERGEVLAESQFGRDCDIALEEASRRKVFIAAEETFVKTASETMARETNMTAAKTRLEVNSSTR